MKAIRACLASAVWVAVRVTPATAAPDDLERSVALMARIGSASSPSFSPDGRTLAYVTNLGGLPQVWTVDAAGGYPQLVTAFDDPVGFVEWSPAGEWLAFTLAPGGGMNEQVYLVRPDGTGLKRLTDGGKETNRLGPWADDGRTLAMGSNKRDGAAIDAYVYDVAAGTAKLAAQNRGIGGFEDLSRDGKWGLLNRLVNRGDNNLYLVELSSGRETLLTPHQGPGTFSGEFARDGGAVYLETNADRDQTAFGRMELGINSGTGKPGKPCFRYTVRSSSLNESGQMAVGDIRLFPLGDGEKATVAVEPDKAFDLGGGPGKPIEREVRGGTVGLVLDARGRPLLLPTDRATGRGLVDAWVTALQLYPQLERKGLRA